MLDTYTNNSSKTTNNIELNAITGTIVKNYKDSFFKRFSLHDKIANQLFDEGGAYLTKTETKYYDNSNYKSYNSEVKIPVVILQMMMCGKDEVLCELIFKDNFEKMFQN